MSDPLRDAINIVAEALWRSATHPLETPNWSFLEESQPEAAACFRNEAAALIKRAGLVAHKDRLDLSLKNALLELEPDAGSDLKKSQRETR